MKPTILSLILMGITISGRGEECMVSTLEHLFDIHSMISTYVEAWANKLGKGSHNG